jgi:protein involved in polysaccharide export with SLBB domain
VFDLANGPQTASGERRLKAGDTVRVKRVEVPGHVRTPAYVQGAVGTVDRELGDHANPELLAYQATAPSVPLVRVRFQLADLFPTSDGISPDVVSVDIYEHWLERQS